MKYSFPLKISGVVQQGNHLGNTIGMPTANLHLPSDYDRLAFGVYYSTVKYRGKLYKGITNVGRKPTVNDGEAVNVETYIYDFSGNLYGETITVTLLEFRRPEKKFNSFEELSIEMHNDLAAGRDYIIE